MIILHNIKSDIMAKTKTQPTSVDVYEFINSFAPNAQSIADSEELIKIISEVSGFKPYMWGPSIVGFGTYHYKYASGHEGDAPILGFSPRKAALSLYVYTGVEEHSYLLNDLGKFKMGKACIYVKKLSDINLDRLKEMMRFSIQYVKEKYDTTD